MRRDLLDFVACPVCLGDLEVRTPHQGVGSPDPEIVDGLLACRSCERWYPVRDRIPELYPDHLRDRERDLEFIAQIESAIGLELADSLRARTSAFSAVKSPGAESDRRNTADLPVEKAPIAAPVAEWKRRKTESEKKNSAYPAAGDPGRSWKKAEMDIASRVDDPNFFSPGRTAPFNPADPEYTTRAIRRFGVALSLLDLKPGAVVLDIGTGYAWTSEWLSRSGFVAIGLDICRTYLDIGRRRMGTACPHLVAADVENLPLKTGCLDAVLAFDAFHHVPDRPAAMRHFFRALKTPGRVVLAEPGPGHGTEPGSVEVMKKYGILEKGLSRRDVAMFCRDLPAAAVREHHVFRLTRGSLPATLKTGRDLVQAVIHAAAALLPARLRRALHSPKTIARLKKAFRYSDYRFFTIDKKGRPAPSP